jgi:NAD(P)-dependent dehydrogenase (short-subunit alcohol dehydrogenase family)
MLYSSCACTPSDLANSVAFLASPAARCITGQSLIIDGGRTPSIRNHRPGVAVTP